MLRLKVGRPLDEMYHRRTVRLNKDDRLCLGLYAQTLVTVRNRTRVALAVLQDGAREGEVLAPLRIRAELDLRLNGTHELVIKPADAFGRLKWWLYTLSSLSDRSWHLPFSWNGHASRRGLIQIHEIQRGLRPTDNCWQGDRSVS